MEIDNWQTMMLIFEVVCKIFKKQKEKYEDLISKLNSYSLKEITDEKYKGWQYLIRIEKKGGEITLICFMDNKVKVNDIVYEVRDYNIDDFSYLFE